MKAENMMNAIGGISDRHIEEFAVVKPVIVKNMIWRRFLLVASFCLALTMLHHSVYFQEESFFEKNVAKIIWNDAETNDEVNDYISQSVPDSILLTESLKIALENADNDEALFAIQVTETTGKSREYIYQSFLKELGGTKEYMKSGIIYFNAQQIASLECPSDLGLILSLAVKNDE